jgi:hypothetical protein
VTERSDKQGAVMLNMGLHYVPNEVVTVEPLNVHEVAFLVVVQAPVNAPEVVLLVTEAPVDVPEVAMSIIVLQAPIDVPEAGLPVVEAPVDVPEVPLPVVIGEAGGPLGEAAALTDMIVFMPRPRRLSVRLCNHCCS